MIRRLARAFATGVCTALGLAVVGNVIDYWQGRQPASQPGSTT